MEEIKKDKDYFLNILQTLAKKSTCERGQVSSIILKDNYIISTGYNGAPRNADECVEVGCLLDERGRCVRTIHAESNAIINAAKNGIDINAADMISLYKPCYRCIQKIINSGIERCFYYRDYSDKYQEKFESNSFCNFIKL